MANIRLLLSGLTLAALSLTAFAQDPEAFKAPPGPDGENIGVDQNLDGQVPLNTQWVDEHGKKVTLGEYFTDKPVLFVPVFYGCKGICLVTMDGVLNAIKNMRTYNVGRDFEIVTFSIHPKETPEMAMKMKQTAMTEYQRPGAPEGWHFLTGTDASIKPLTKALGFNYVYDEKANWIDHPAAIIVATPEGKISRYFINVNYAPKTVLTALQDASKQKIGTLTEPVWFGCLSRNKSTGALTVNVNRVVQLAAILTFAILGTSIFMMSRKYKTTALKRTTPRKESTEQP
ncbi:MAG: SCO family protein [Fimbriimonadaceae bacterium]|nr:SCO family protein [Fimbriimonadaceae bacterium]